MWRISLTSSGPAAAESGKVCSASRFFFSRRRRHTRFKCDWSSDVCSSDLEMAGKRLQLLREAAPTVARIAVLNDPGQPDTDLRETEAAARALGVQLQAWKVRRGGDL